jgi:hypothetical protein
MATQHTTSAEQAVHHAAALLAGIDWMDQAAAQQLSPLAEAVVNVCVMVYYQAETGQATPDDFHEVLAAIRQSLQAQYAGRQYAIRRTNITALE